MSYSFDNWHLEQMRLRHGDNSDNISLSDQCISPTIKENEILTDSPPKKTVRYAKTCSLILIPTRHEYAEAQIDLWYGRFSFEQAKLQASLEIKSLMTTNPYMTFEKAVNLLYQPSSGEIQNTHPTRPSEKRFNFPQFDPTCSNPPAPSHQQSPAQQVNQDSQSSMSCDNNSEGENGSDHGSDHGSDDYTGSGRSTSSNNSSSEELQFLTDCMGDDEDATSAETDSTSRESNESSSEGSNNKKRPHHSDSLSFSGGTYRAPQSHDHDRKGFVGKEGARFRPAGYKSMSPESGDISPMSSCSYGHRSPTLQINSLRPSADLITGEGSTNKVAHIEGGESLLTLIS